MNLNNVLVLTELDSDFNHNLRLYFIKAMLLHGCLFLDSLTFILINGKKEVL